MGGLLDVAGTETNAAQCSEMGEGEQVIPETQPPTQYFVQSESDNSTEFGEDTESEGEAPPSIEPRNLFPLPHLQRSRRTRAQGEPLIDYSKSILMTSEEYIAAMEEKVAKREAVAKEREARKNQAEQKKIQREESKARKEAEKARKEAERVLRRIQAERKKADRERERARRAAEQARKRQEAEARKRSRVDGGPSIPSF